MIPPVQSILENLAIHSVSDRIFQTNAPQAATFIGGTRLDYIVWQIISNVATLNLSDTPDDDIQLVQIDVYSVDQENCRGLAQRVRNGIEAVADVTRGPEPLYEPDTELYRWSMDASFFNVRSSE